MSTTQSRSLLLTLATVGLSFFFSVSVVHAQDAVPNFHSGNKLRVTFSADGQIGTIGEELGLEWPIGTGREYLDVAFPVLIQGQESVIFSPNTTTLSPTPGHVPMSHLEASWPTSWNGQWNGFRGTADLVSDQESVFVMDASGASIQMTIRGWQWSQFLAQDMVVLHYTIQNTGNDDIDDLKFGFVVDPAVGGDDDDRVSLDTGLGAVTVTDSDGVGQGRGVASGIGQWMGVGRFSIAFLETPGIDSDGVDNDNDGLVDESRTDGIDNDGDWNLDTDDVGADGLADTGDSGESDGVPTAGEPHFDLTDIDESDEVGLSSFSVLAESGLEPGDSRLAALLTPGRFDTDAQAEELVLGTGSFTIPAGGIQQIAVILYLSDSEIDQTRNESFVAEIRSRNYALPVGPPRPIVNAVRENGQVTLYWDNRAEATPGFEGYKIFKSTDPGFNDVYTVTDDRGNVIYSDPEAMFDLNNGVPRFFGLHANGFRYFLGRDTGITHWWVDENVINGQTYYYAVVAFDRGDVTIPDYPAESTKSIVVHANGEIDTDLNTVRVVPTVEAVGYTEPDFTFEHASGEASGSVTAVIIDRTAVRDSQYRLTFSSNDQEGTTYTLTDLSEGMRTVFDHSSNFSTPTFRNEEDPQFDGLRIFVEDSVLEWDSLSTEWTQGDSNWRINLSLNANLGPPTPVAANYEVRFGPPGFDTAIFTTPLPVPFQVWNIIDNRKENILVLDQNADGAWSSGEPIYIVEGSTLEDFRPIYWTITLTAPTDPAVTPVAPVEGDIAFISTFKPFSEQDTFVLTSTAAGLSADPGVFTLDNIATVPNPFIVRSGIEQRSLLTGGEFILQLQFIHLPQRCTIRIFNMRGRLIDTIEHDGLIDDGTAYWDLHTKGSDSNLVAPGIYIYHVEAPGLGETLGRFAVIR